MFCILTEYDLRTVFVPGDSGGRGKSLRSDANAELRFLMFSTILDKGASSVLHRRYLCTSGLHLLCVRHYLGGFELSGEGARRHGL